MLLRNPGYSTPPFSRDEFLGCVSLGLLKNYGTFFGWNFSPYPFPKFSLSKLLSQLWQLRPGILADRYITLFKFFGGKSVKLPLGYNLSFKSRNYFWENNLDQIYRFAFSVPVVDRYSILKTWDKFQWYKPSHCFYFLAAQVDKRLGHSGLSYLKYGGEKNAQEMVKEFPVIHPIRLKLGL